jgi:hypothetical protein
MAEVFRALAQGVEGFQRVFVVKRILQDKSANPAFIEMFINEARSRRCSTTRTSSRSTTSGTIEDSYFCRMEYLRGKDLLSVLRQLRAAGRPCPPTVAALHRARGRRGPGLRARPHPQGGTTCRSSTATSRPRTSCCCGRAG